MKGKGEGAGDSPTPASPPPRHLEIRPAAREAAAETTELVKRAYLAVYNWAVFFRWALLRSGHEDVYAAVGRPLQLAQIAAVLEILHGLVGLVKSPVSATLPLIGSCFFVTWGILWSFPEVECSSPWRISLFYSSCCVHTSSSVFLALFSCMALQTRTHILVSSLVIRWSITEAT